MKSNLVALLILFSITHGGFSQCTEFKIYRTKGDVTLLPGSVKGIGLKYMTLNEQSVLNIAPEGYVILLSGSDKALRITTPGKYSYADIKTTCQQNQTSLTKE
jgi:hypothetical protein